MDALLTIEQIMSLGISKATIWRKTRNGEWDFVYGKRDGKKGGPPKLIKLSSLPVEMQQEWARRNESAQAAAASDEQPVEKGESSSNVHLGDAVEPSPLDRLNLALRRFSLDQRDAWLAELNRLSNLVQRYAEINPKRSRDSETGKYEFVAGVQGLCAEAVCSDRVILGVESHRAEPPSPHTLDGWLRGYRKNGLLTFLRSPSKPNDAKRDRRRAVMTEAAFEWVNQNWRNYRSPRALYKALQKKAKREQWTIPAEAWIYRRWKAARNILELIRAYFVKCEQKACWTPD